MGDVMPRIRKLIAVAFALIPLVFVFAPSAARAEKRVALVVGNAGYQVGALATPANDAGLIAQTLQAAGFDVVGARDLDQDSLRRALRDFLEKATAAGPDTVAFVYVSGYGVQLEGENYFVPVDAKIARDADVAAEAIRMSDYIRPLAALKLKASIVVLDAARANPFAKSGPPLAGRRQPGAGRAGARRADRVQRRAGDGGAGGTGPVWSLRPGAGRDAARRRAAARRGVRSRAAARQRRDQGRRGSVACVESGDLARILRARVRCAAARRFERTDGSDPRAADSRSRRAGSLRRGVGARHAGWLFGIPYGLSRRPHGGTRARHRRRPARGDHVAANPRRRHAACLLVLSAALSAGAARGRCAPPSGFSCRRLRAAAGVHGHGL